jgi:hypothetical protein
MRAANPAAWSRRYPPLTSGAIILLLLAFVMPSGLRLPQTNPAQTLEYAPVPPNDDSPAQSSGNASSLGLGSSLSQTGDTVGGIGPGGLPAPAAAPPGVGTVPSNKRCVGSPPRQTEDPMSPPCVAFFQGDNGGATYTGVKKNEIRVVVYADPISSVSTDDGFNSEQANMKGRLIDLATPAETGEPVTVRNVRRFARYFNERYQTYGRFVHIWLKFGNKDGSTTPEERRADAASVIAAVHPFAVLDSGMVIGQATAWNESVANRGVLVFAGPGAQDAAFSRKYPGLVWGSGTTIQKRAELFSSYLCSKVVGKPVVDSGDPAQNGKPRRLGLISTSDPARPTLIMFAALVKKQVQACGGKFWAEGTFPQSGAVAQTRGSDPSATYAQRNMADFQGKDITTVIWAGGFETDQSKAANQIGYRPEWVLGGDGQMETPANTTYQEQTEFAHAWVATNVTQVDHSFQPCQQAVREADPSTGDADLGLACSRPWYVDFRQLFTGIQVAGPRLTPQSMDQGFHAIPGIPSVNPHIPACFYEQDDYACVKDAAVEFWDPNGTTPDGPNGAPTNGCWRMVQKGARFLAGQWPSGNITAQRKVGDCNGYNTTAVPVPF